jgi:cbb3-type cytochrome oxidase maturation protein
MEVLWLLIPMSVLLMLGVLAVFAWAIWGGQFDDLEQQGHQALQAEWPELDDDQNAGTCTPEQ